MRDQIAGSLVLVAMIFSPAATGQPSEVATAPPCRSGTPEAQKSRTPLRVAAEGTISPLPDSNLRRLLAERERHGRSVRIYLVLEGLQARRATSVSFELLFGLYDVDAQHLLSASRVDEFVIFDLRPHRRSTDVTAAVAKLASEGLPDVPLGVQIRPDLGGDVPSEEFRKEMAEAAVVIEAACLTVE